MAHRAQRLPEDDKSLELKKKTKQTVINIDKSVSF